MNSQLTLNITLLSDWHIGSGSGRNGDFDRMVRRDRQGLPYLPAKTLTGILRDACEQVAWGLDNGASTGAWQDWVLYLFGSQPTLGHSPETPPTPARLRLRSAHFPPSLAQAFTHKPALRDALTFAKPGVKIDAQTGYTEANCLRLEEMARGGLTLQTHCELLEICQSDWPIAIALITSGAAFVERLGGNRRRGAGRCQLSIAEYSLQQALQTLQATPTPPPPATTFSPNPIQPPRTQDSVSADGSSEWHAIALKITAKSPLLIYKQTVGNVVECLDYIPGSYLLPLVIKAMAQSGIDVDRAIEQEDIRVLPATIQIGNEPGKPIPFALFREKLAPHRLHNYLRINPTHPNLPQLQQCRTGYLRDTTEPLPSIVQVPMQVETHNTILDEKQRPDSSIGGVYTYEAIAAGTVFMAEVRYRQSGSEWWRQLPQKAAIGRAKKDEYGWIELEVCSVPERPSVSRPNPQDTLEIWLLSDTLLRDDWLQPTVSVETLTQHLSDRLNVTLTLEQSLTRHRRIESWQNRWNLPRPSLVGLSAGSCFRFRIAAGTVTPQQLTALEQEGIGERRVEGYGQLACHPKLLQTTQFTVQMADDAIPADPSCSLPPTIEADHHSYARLIEATAWRQQIRRAAQIVASDPANRQKILGITVDAKGRSQPSLSQLGTLRSQINKLRADPQNGVQETREWLDKLDMKQRWDSAPLKAVVALLNPQTVWSYLNLETTLEMTEEAMMLTSLETIKQEIWPEAVQILVDSCIRAHRRHLED